MAPLPPFFAAIGKVLGPLSARVVAPAVTRLGLNKLGVLGAARVSARLAPFFRRNALLLAEQGRERQFLDKFAEGGELWASLKKYEIARLKALADHPQGAAGRAAKGRHGNKIFSTDRKNGSADVTLEAEKRVAAAFRDAGTRAAVEDFGKRKGQPLQALARYNQFVVEKILPAEAGLQNTQNAAGGLKIAKKRTSSRMAEEELLLSKKSSTTETSFWNRPLFNYMSDNPIRNFFNQSRNFSPVYSVARLPAGLQNNLPGGGGQHSFAGAQHPYRTNPNTFFHLAQQQHLHQTDLLAKDVHKLKTEAQLWHLLYRTTLLFPAVAATIVVLSSLEKQEEKFDDQEKRWRFCLVSPGQEREVGREGSDQLKQQYQKLIYNSSHPLHREIVRVTNSLLQPDCLPQGFLDKPAAKEIDWRIAVVDEPDTMNAMVLPDGYVFVYTGLLEKCVSEDEVAAVLGHEISHVLLRHGAEQLSSGSVLAIPGNFLEMFAFLIGGFTSVIASVYASKVLGGLLLELPQSRFCEREADELGLRISTLAGYDPLAAARLWARLGDEATNSALRKYVVEKIKEEENYGCGASCTSSSEGGVMNDVDKEGATDSTLSQAASSSRNNSKSSSLAGLGSAVFGAFDPFASPHAGGMALLGGAAASGGAGTPAGRGGTYSAGFETVTVIRPGDESLIPGNEATTPFVEEPNVDYNRLLDDLEFFSNRDRARRRKVAVQDSLATLSPYFSGAFLESAGLLGPAATVPTEDDTSEWFEKYARKVGRNFFSCCDVGAPAAPEIPFSETKTSIPQLPSTTTVPEVTTLTPSKAAPAVPPEWFSTHPSYESRVACLLQLGLDLQKHPFYSTRRRHHSFASNPMLSLRRFLSQMESGFSHPGGGSSRRAGNQTADNASRTELERWCEHFRRRRRDQDRKPGPLWVYRTS
ncbi:unnamed protein product [Amoebophrya sp. A120]|nr:unnamed protein product [Amoebophrya sp. A120]|eukprot:GSA120T00008301001.1